MEKAVFIKLVTQILIEDLFVAMEPEQITETQSIANDLGVDSVGFVELATLVGERLSISFEESELTDGSFATIGALWERASQKLEQKRAAAK